MKTVRVNPRLVIEPERQTDYESEKSELENLKDELEARNYITAMGSWAWGMSAHIECHYVLECEACGYRFEPEDRELVGLECEGCGAEVCDGCRHWGEHDEMFCENCYFNQREGLI
jgi:hypothetical protein